jgi:hypothetical protein
MILQDREWRLKYTPDHGDLVRSLYVPALSCAARYDRLTGFFAASALGLAARGVEHMVANGGRMRMVVGCTLEQKEINAIERGEALKKEVEQRLRAVPLTPTDPKMSEALELLAWMVAQGHLEVRVAVPCNAARKPVPADGGLQTLLSVSSLNRSSPARPFLLVEMAEVSEADLRSADGDPSRLGALPEVLD